jgi:hypothetical protein
MYYESALGTALSLQAEAGLKSPLLLPPEHSFFLMLSEQVSTTPLDVKDGRFRLPAEADLSRLVDWNAVKRFAI